MSDSTDMSIWALQEGKISQFVVGGGNLTILWPHTVNIYVNLMLTVLWKLTIWWSILSLYFDNLVKIQWQYCEFLTIWWTILWIYCDNIATEYAKPRDVIVKAPSIHRFDKLKRYLWCWISITTKCLYDFGGETCIKIWLWNKCL